MATLIPADQSTPSRQVIRREQRDRVRAAFARLSSRDQEMLTLRHLEQLKLKVQAINDEPSTMELLYGYFPMNIGALIFWWL